MDVDLFARLGGPSQLAEGVDDVIPSSQFLRLLVIGMTGAQLDDPIRRGVQAGPQRLGKPFDVTDTAVQRGPNVFVAIDTDEQGTIDLLDRFWVHGVTLRAVR